MFYIVDPVDSSSAITNVIKNCDFTYFIDRSTLIDALLAREEMMSTAIGNGIAIPHVRLFDSMSLQEDIVAVAYLFEPVDWKAPDEKPVHTLFFVLAADETRHLQILAEIAQLASDEDFVEFLRTMPAKEALIERIQQLEEKVNTEETSNSQDS
ncbi:MAG TPA: PTS sugar transporter subunit IIA [Rectinema sp.]|nr:PTS sugar transporter subunit IIA [Rectinema sp.]